jgi:hypothetical protein
VRVAAKTHAGNRLKSSKTLSAPAIRIPTQSSNTESMSKEPILINLDMVTMNPM